MALQPISEKAKLAVVLGTEVLQLLSGAEVPVWAACSTGTAFPAAGHRARAPRVSHWALAAHPLQDLGNHCPSMAWLLGKNKKVILIISYKSLFLLLIM